MTAADEIPTEDYSGDDLTFLACPNCAAEYPPGQVTTLCESCGWATGDAIGAGE